MKLANGSEELQMRTLQGAKNDVEGAAKQPVSEPITTHCDHGSRRRSRSSSEEMQYILPQQSQQLFNSKTACLSGEDDCTDNSQPLIVGNEGPSVVAKAIVCVIAFIIMAICLCFLFI
ncbi:unnamed protein product [Litomosoides sigmodontis]|uniref:Uncharacterized protein n=1 Tax=Litomosoides sigmodontis TaxID=42156 RepID=A0A3P6TN97_LITSI|nr:unnamed protein product [Litomosoides sigmodontis]